MMLVGYKRPNKYVLYDYATKKLHVSRNVHINENETFKLKLKPEESGLEQLFLMSPDSTDTGQEREGEENIEDEENLEIDDRSVENIRRSTRINKGVPPTKLSLAALIPNNYQEAISQPEASEWKKAITAEYCSLLEHNVFTEVKADDQKIIKTRWVFATKKDTNGKIYQYKARLVAKGFNQILVLIMKKPLLQ